MFADPAIASFCQLFAIDILATSAPSSAIVHLLSVFIPMRLSMSAQQCRCYFSRTLRRGGHDPPVALRELPRSALSGGQMPRLQRRGAEMRWR